MGPGSDLDIIGTLETSVSVPSMDIDSSRSTTSQNPSKAQVEANYLSRNLELAVLDGSVVQGLVLAQSLNESDLSSDEVTESAVVSTALGNASGLIIALAMHFFLRSHYRTGIYQIQLKADKPTDEELAKMKKSDVFIYLSRGKLNYFVKRSSSELIHGQIDDDNEGGNEKSRTAQAGALTKLRARLETMPAAGVQHELPPDCERAFLNITHSRGHTYSARTSTNPLYRAVKTLSAFGARLAAFVSAFIGSNNPNQRRIISFILADIFCIVFGIVGIFYYVVRDKVLKIPPNTKHQFDLTGLEGWSKYAKTALTFGTAVGQGIGGLIIGIANASSSTAATVSSFSIAFWGGGGGCGQFCRQYHFSPPN